MNELMSLRHIREEIGVSRKAIQGYEKHGLIKPCGKDKYGHLLYDEETVKRIIRIRFFQKMGFKVSEIKKFIDKPNEEIMSILKAKRDSLNEELVRFAKLLCAIDDLLDTNELNEEKILQIAKENELK